MSRSPTVKPSRQSFQLLLGLIRPYRLHFIGGLVSLAVGSGINLLFPEIIRRVLDSEHFSVFSAHPWLIAAGLISLFALQSVAFFIRSYFFGALGQKAVTRLRQDLYSALVRREIEFFERQRVGDLVSMLGVDTSLVQDAISIKLSVFIRYSFQVLVGIVMMFIISAKLTLAILASLPVLVGISMVLGKRLRLASRAQQEELGRSLSLAEESLSGIRVVKVFDQEAREISRQKDLLAKVLALGMRRTTIAAFFQSFVSFLMNLCIVLVLVYGIQLVVQNQVSVGDLTAFLLYGAIVAISFAFVAGGYSEFVQALGGTERVFELIQHRAPPKPIDALEHLPQAVRGEFTFEKVTFAYPGRPEAVVFDKQSFRIEAGKVTALVGPSGAGKSTVVALLLRFYDPISGRITLDGTDLTRLDPKEIYKHLALVPQEPVLFGVSVAENLRFGKQEATMTELEEACRQANILDFIDSLPNRFETNVGQRGVQLSGGEKQRLAIARAILKNPAILLLDEATSSLDSRNEALVQEALQHLVRGRTCLVIAHRLSTIQHADRIIVLDHGQVVQIGNHEDLRRADGLYRELVEKQQIIASVTP